MIIRSFAGSEFQMTFKELVASYSEGKTSYDELILEVRCESCFASIYSEASVQLGSASKLLVQLADEFPNHYKSYAKQEGLDG